MTIYERTQQLERRKTIAGCCIAGGMVLGALAFMCKMGPCSVDATIDETEDVFEASTEYAFNPVLEIAEAEVELVKEATEIEEETEIVELEIEVEEADQEEVVNTTPKYSEKEIEELAHMIWAEGGSKGDEAMYAVGTVIVNRINSKRYPNTLHKVLTERHKSKGKWVYQYSPAKGNSYMKNKPSDRCKEIARDILENNNLTLPASILGQSGKITAEKYGKQPFYLQIDNMYFFELK